MPVIIVADLSKQLVSVNVGKRAQHKVPTGSDLNTDTGLTIPEIDCCLHLSSVT